MRVQTRVEQGQIEGLPGGVRFPVPPPSAQTGPAGLLATAARNAAPSNNFRQTDPRQPSPDKSAALSRLDCRFNDRQRLTQTLPASRQTPGERNGRF
jgi:hypothetical protein